MTEQLHTQALEALALANDVRVKRAVDKKAIKRGALDPAEILRDPPPHWRKARLHELLLAMPKVGRVKAQKWCRLEHISLNFAIAELTERQKTVLYRQVSLHVKRRDDARAVLQETVS